MTSTKTGSVNINARTGRLCITDVIPVPMKTAWAMLTNRHHISQWWGEYVSIETHPGGTFEQLWRDPEGTFVRAFGTVREVTAPFCLEVSWREEAWPFTTTVSLHLRDFGEFTEVTILHHDWPKPADDTTRRAMAKHYQGWKTCLARLKHYAERQNHHNHDHDGDLVPA